MLDCSPEILAQ